MTNLMCTLTATLHGRPEKRTELVELLTTFLVKSRSEEGCVEYQLQASHNDPDTFVFYENWVSKDHLDRHMALPYQTEWFARQPELLAEPAELHFYSMIGDHDNGVR
jgi:quinol monooxygenase YgiN